MTVKYMFVTGEEVYVEVYGRLERIMSKFNRESKSKDNRGLNNNEILHMVISKLRTEEKEMLYSLYLSNQPTTQKEYAEKLGIASSTMKKRVKKLKSKLARLIEAYK